MRSKIAFFIVLVNYPLQMKIFGQNCVNPNPLGCGSVGQCTTIELDLPQNNNCTSIDYSAGENIKFKPGFSYKATPGKRLHAWIESPIYDAAYNPFFDEDDFDNRELDTDLPVGSIAGSASVSATGAATYIIPIHAPPGTAGMQPSVSLTYNSQSRNGIAGYGWSLSGISSISRIGGNFFHDGGTSPIAFSSGGPFALDGNRLIPCPATIHQTCTTNATACPTPAFYTEVETYSKITKNGSLGNGPEWFNVETKDGLIIEYGRTEDSRIAAPSPNAPNVLVWNVSKIYDRYGNYISYKYRKFKGEEISVNQTIIDRIEYTGNSNTSPYNSIKFFYEGREDIDSAYINGSLFCQTLLLREIQVLAEEEIIKKYSLTHSNNEEYSFLSEIKEYGIKNSELNTTMFKYPVGSLNTSNPQYLITTPDGIPDGFTDYITGDFNGDGRSDLISFPYSLFNTGGELVKVYNTLSSFFFNEDGTNFNNTADIDLPDGFSAPINVLETNKPFYNKYGPQGIEANMFFSTKKEMPISNVMGADFNGDGLSDLLLRVYSQGKYTYVPYISTGDINNPFTEGNLIDQNLLDANHGITIGDFNGDKISDVFIINFNAPNYAFYLFNKDGTPATPILNNLVTSLENTAYSPSQLSGYFFPMDFNGDGKQELLSFRSNFNEAIILNINPLLGKLNEIHRDNFPNGAILNNNDLIYLGDFNGDGITDILSPQGPSGWQLGYGTGKEYLVSDKTEINGLQQGLLESTHPYYPIVHISIGDFNGDGKDDILQTTKEASQTYPNNPFMHLVFLSNGMGFTPKQFGSFGLLGKRSYHLGNFSGEGNVEILQRIDENFIRLININPISNKKYLLSDVVDGYNRKTSFAYEFLSKGGNFYSKGTGAAYPVIDFQGPVCAVSKMTVPDGIGGYTDISYSYKGAKVHQQGKGFLTFSEVTAQNNTSGISSIAEYELLSSFFFPILKKTKSVTNSPDDKLLSETIFTNAIIDYTLTCPFSFNPPLYLSTHKRFFPFSSKVVSKDYLRDITITADYTYNLDGNLTSQTTNYGGVETQTIQNTVWVQKGSWIPNRLKDQTINMSRAGDIYEIKKHNDYNDEGKLIETEVINDNDPLKNLIANYNYYAATGNLKSAAISTDQPLLEDRITTYEYDSKGRFVTKMINPLLQISEAEYDARWGKPLKEKSISGLVTTYRYDDFGRLIKMKTPDNIETNYSISFVTTAVDDPFGNPLPALYSTFAHRDGSPGSTIFYDMYGRKIKTQNEGLVANINMVQSFNNKGQLSVQHAPYFDNELPEFSTTYTYFDIGLKTGQPQYVINSLSGITGFNYSASGGEFTTEVTNPANQALTTKTDAAGKVISAKDDNGTELVYSYYSHGGLKEVKQKQGDKQLAFIDYDFYARKKKLKDRNANDIDYDYNAYGELSSQTDKLGNQYTMVYDKLGRISTKTGPDGTTAYQYYSTGTSVNLLQTVTGPNGITQQYSYDDLGRLTTLIENIENPPCTTQYAYDQFSNISGITYPSGFTLEKSYNAKGYLTEVKSGTSVIWSDPAMNALGQYTGHKNGNIPVNKEYDPLGMLLNYSAGTNGSIHNMFFDWDEQSGNLKSRTDFKAQKFESFSYDNLNRLKTALVLGQTDAEETDYYENGNIKTKSRIGGYSYDDDKLNAVEQVGNNVGDISGFTQVITYTPFNKCSTITENNKFLTLAYGPDNQRRISELKDNGTTTKKIIYSGNYEKITDENGDVYEVHYLGFEAINVRKNGKPSSDQVFFAYTDHLGSIVKITNASGAPVYEQNFDAWGRKRDPAEWDYDLSDYTQPALPAGTHDPQKWLIRGFTGHEQLDDFALINMNGRVYDPLLGRMNSPDNNVQSPLSTQSYNRYSYANNNPLKYTDPSGNIWGLFRAFNEGVNVLNERVNGNSSYQYNSSYVASGQLPNNWRNNPNVVLGPNGRPMGPNGEYPRLADWGMKDIDGNSYGGDPRNGFVDASAKSYSFDPVWGEAWVGVNSYEKFDSYYIKGYEWAEVQGGGSPLSSSNGETVWSANQFYNFNFGFTSDQIANQRIDRSWLLGSQPGGPRLRYVQDPLSSAVIDMRHMLVIGKYGKEGVGDFIENMQWLLGQPSGRNPQDYFSNALGDAFYRDYGNSISQNPGNFAIYLNQFLHNPQYSYIRDVYFERYGR